MKIKPIQLRRLNAGVETKEAIEKLKISKSTFYKLEGGHTSPSARLIARIAKTYNCSIDDVYQDLNITG